MTDKARDEEIDEKKLQREAKAHRQPYGQTTTEPDDENSSSTLEKTTDDEPVETSMRGQEDATS